MADREAAASQDASGHRGELRLPPPNAPSLRDRDRHSNRPANASLRLGDNPGASRLALTQPDTPPIMPQRKLGALGIPVVPLAIMRLEDEMTMEDKLEAERRQ